MLWTTGTLESFGELQAKAGVVLGPVPGAAALPRLDGGFVALVTAVGSTSTMTSASLEGINGGKILNRGIWNVTDDSSFLFPFSATRPTFVNEGTLRKTGGNGKTRFEWTLSNQGTIRVPSGEIECDRSVTQSGANSALTVDPGTTFSCGAVIDITAGSVGGAGTIKALQLTVDGKFAPTLAPGATLTCQAPVVRMRAPTVSSSSVGGPYSGSPDYSTHLHVEGDLELAGALQVDLWPGYTPPSSFEFEIITVAPAYSMSGTFANVHDGQRLFATGGQGSFLVRFGGPGDEHRVVLTDFQAGGAAVPTFGPAWTSLLAGLALLGCGALCRRRALVG